MVGEVAPVWGIEEEHISLVAWREPADVFGAEHVRRVGRAGAEGFGWREPQAGVCQVHHQRQRLAEGASGIEVRGERQDRSLVGQETGRREGQVEEEPASGEEYGCYVAPRQQDGRFMLRSFQVVYATGAELEGQRDRTPLGELVRMEAEREPVPLARLEVVSRLRHLERTALQEDVGGSGQGRCFWQHFMDHELHVLSRAIELGRYRVRSEKGRIYIHWAAMSCVVDRTQGLQFRLAVEAVARLRLCGRRPVLQHPAEMAFQG